MSRGSIRKRGKKSWALKFDVASDDGKRRTRYATVRCDTRREAQAELTKLLAASDAGTLPDPSNATVTEYIDAWLAAPKGSAKTMERYGELAANQIKPHLGAHKLQRLKPEHVQTWHGTLIGTGLSPRTVKHAHKLLHRVLTDAVKNGTLARNVAGVHAPPSVEEDEIEILTGDQVTDVLAKLDGHNLFPIVSLALATGMRRGELLGLQWGEVDLDAGTLRVERSLEETKSGLRLKPPKSRRGRRNISLPAEAVAMLRDHRVRQMKIRLALGMGRPDAEMLVFSDVEGELLKPHTISRAWRRVVAAKKLPAVTFHALRHTHASMLIRAGVDILTISRRLGHSKAAITLDVYGHLIDGADAAAAKAIEGVLK
jgi:integrase